MSIHKLSNLFQTELGIDIHMVAAAVYPQISNFYTKMLMGQELASGQNRSVGVIRSF